MIDGQKFFDVLDYPYIKERFKLIATDSSKQKAQNTDLKAIHQINFTGNLDQAENITILFFIEEAK